MAKVKYHPVTGKQIFEIPQVIETEAESKSEVNSQALVEEPNRVDPEKLEQAIASKEWPVTITPSESKQAVALVEEVKVLVEDQPEIVGEEGWTTLQLDSQELSSFMACARRYEYIYEMNLVPIGGVSKAVTKGSVYHAALNQYFKERIKTGDYQEAVKIAINTAKTMFEKEALITREERLDYLSNLLEFLRFIQGWNGIPIESEKYFNVLAFEDVKEKLRIYLNGRIDLISKLPQLPILPIDFKTENERWFHSQLSNQYRIYSIACGVNVLGIQRIGSQTTLETKDRFKLELLPFDQDMLDEFRTIQLPYWIRQMLTANETGFFPMNTTDCVHGHFKCQFSDAYNGGICNVSRSVRQQKLDRYFKVGEQWDPSKV